MKRCAWARNDLAVDYHDREWGVPLHNDRELFEFLILEGAQAGLSWDTILAKRENYRRAFQGFDPAQVAGYTEAECAKLLLDPGIIRNRLKIASAVTNAKAFIALQQEFGSFDTYVWEFVGRTQIDGKRLSSEDVPAKTDVSDALSNDLRKRGFKFVGSTIMYAFMQATGLVNDHLASCFRYEEIKLLSSSTTV